jgi:hypothetical protein
MGELKTGGTMNGSNEHAGARGRFRPASVALALVAALSLSFAIVAYAADPRLDEADQALQKAAALLEASQSTGSSPHVAKEFDRRVGRAGELIDRAREQVQAAKAAVDAELEAPVAP